MSPALDVAGLLRRLWAAGVQHVLVGGMAVNAHGVIRATQDVDICPSPDPENLERLACLLRELDVRRLGVTEAGFEQREMPLDPTDPADLAQGGNFRLETAVGILDIMQSIPGIDAEHAYETLARDAEEADAFGVKLRVCSLAALRQMKRAAAARRRTRAAPAPRRREADEREPRRGHRPEPQAPPLRGGSVRCLRKAVTEPRFDELLRRLVAADAQLLQAMERVAGRSGDLADLEGLDDPHGRQAQISF